MTDDAFAIESGWARREPFVQLAPERIASLLAPVFGACTLESVKPLSGGLANTNYRVHVAEAARPVVLRLYTRDGQACARDVALFQLVAGEVPTPELLFADVSGDRFAYPYAIMTWIDGPPLAEALAAEPAAAFDLGRAAGAALPPIGMHRFDQPGDLAPDLSVLPPPAQGPTTFFDHIEFCLARNSDAALVSTAFVERVRTFVRANAAYLPGPDSALVHGDYKPGNILLNRDGRGWTVAAVIDWEFAFSGPSLFDLGTLLRYADDLPPAFEHGVVDGYTAAGGVLPSEWKRYIRLPDFANLCDFLTAPRSNAAVVNDVQRLIIRTMDGWASYG